MKQLIIAIIVILNLDFASLSYADSIQIISNLQQDNLLLSILSAKAPTKPQLLNLNLAKMSSQILPWPKDLDNEEVIGLLLLSDRIILISQWTAGDGKFPHVYELMLQTQSWTTVGELNCVSFDQIEIKNSKLTVHCEANPQTDKEAGPVSVTLVPKYRSTFSTTLPQMSAKTKTLSVQLIGPIFKVEKIELLLPEKKTLTVSDLLKTIKP